MTFKLKIKTKEEIRLEDAEKKASLEAEKSELYLASTDWRVIRAMEKGEKVPADISAARENARVILSRGKGKQ